MHSMRYTILILSLFLYVLMITLCSQVHLAESDAAGNHHDQTTASLVMVGARDEQTLQPNLMASGIGGIVERG